MDYSGTVKNAISVFEYWIFDPNYKKALVLNRDYLDMICAPSVGGEEVAVFETVFTAVIFRSLSQIFNTPKHS